MQDSGQISDHLLPYQNEGRLEKIKDPLSALYSPPSPLEKDSFDIMYKPSPEEFLRQLRDNLDRRDMYCMLYNAALFNAWAKLGIFHTHKSYKDSNGEDICGGAYFVTVATLPTGQISNHYFLKYWHLFNIPARESP